VKVYSIPISEIRVLRSERQRTLIDVEDLKSSISQHGLIQPVVVDSAGTLIAGERRLTACKALGWDEIPAVHLSDLSPLVRQILELEENLKREELPWRDHVKAVARLHGLYRGQAPEGEWAQSDTAKALGIDNGSMSHLLRVAKDLDSPRLAQATGFRQAYNILARLDDRVIGDAMSDIIEAGIGVFAKAQEKAPQGEATQGEAKQGEAKQGEAASGPSESTLFSSPSPSHSPRPSPTPAPESILETSFLDWAPQYSGKPFNFLHCDFPYGIKAFSGPLSGRASWTTYNDDPDVYWALIEALGQNLDRVLAHSAHLMFWFSMEHYHATLEAFRTLMPSLEIQVFPLVWVKSDNVGLMPDPKRGPRRVYETCLIGSRGDRQVVKPVANAYSAPTNKEHHPSTKPEPVLRHFMQMFVDEHTRMLDPTCGGGSALRAAESLGAKEVLGLEIDPEHASNAKKALRQFRALRAAPKA